MQYDKYMHAKYRDFDFAHRQIAPKIGNHAEAQLEALIIQYLVDLQLHVQFACVHVCPLQIGLDGSCICHVAVAWEWCAWTRLSHLAKCHYFPLPEAKTHIYPTRPWVGKYKFFYTISQTSQLRACIGQCSTGVCSFDWRSLLS